MKTIFMHLYQPIYSLFKANVARLQYIIFCVDCFHFV